MLGDQHSFTSCWETDWRQTTKPTRRRRPSSLASSLRWWQTSGHTLHDIFASFPFFYFAHLMFLKQNLRLKYRYTIKDEREEGPRERKGQFEAKTRKSDCSRRCPWVASARKLPPRNEDADTRPIAFAIYGMKLFYCAAPKTSHNYTSSPGVGS